MVDQTITRFWDHYLEKLKTYGINPTALRWPVRQAEAYIKAMPERRLASHTAQDMERYLPDKGRNTQLKGWQFQQMVTALQGLFIALLNAAWASAFPWEVWRINACDLCAPFKNY